MRGFKTERIDMPFGIQYHCAEYALEQKGDELPAKREKNPVNSKQILEREREYE
jgi:hypothetical protein